MIFTFIDSINSFEDKILSKVLKLVVDRVVFAIIRISYFKDKIEWLYLYRYLHTIFKNDLISAG